MPKKEITYKSPIYLQLRGVVREKIEEGEYLPGMAIPSESSLAETYGINRHTVRNAIDALVDEGKLKRVQGKGVYVVGERAERDLEHLGGFTQTMKEKNSEPTTKIISKYIRKAGDKFSRIFNISGEDEVYYIKRICYADGDPVSLEEIYIPHYVIPKLAEIDLFVFSLYEVYEFYGINLQEADQTLEIVYMNQSDARIIDIDSDRPVFLFECTSYDDKKRVVEFSNTYTRGDTCVFGVNFKK